MLYKGDSINKDYFAKGVYNKKHCRQIPFFQGTSCGGFLHISDNYQYDFLQRGKTPPMNVLFMTLNNLMMRYR